MRKFHLVLLGDHFLAFFDDVIFKLNHFSTLKAYKVVVMIFVADFKNRLSTFKMVAVKNTCVIKLV